MSQTVSLMVPVKRNCGTGSSLRLTPRHEEGVISNSTALLPILLSTVVSLILFGCAIEIKTNLRRWPNCCEIHERVRSVELTRYFTKNSISLIISLARKPLRISHLSLYCTLTNTP